MFTSVVIRFLVMNLVLSIMTAIFIFIKRTLAEHLPAQTRYHLWFLYGLLLLCPFFPVNNPLFNPLTRILKTGHEGSSLGPFPDTLAAPSLGSILNSNALSTDIGIFTDPNKIFFILWLFGAALTLAFTIIGAVHIQRVIRKSKQITDSAICRLFTICKARLGLNIPITLAASRHISSPVSFGLIHPYVLLPETILNLQNASAIHHILLHELCHFKRRDMAVSYLAALIRIIYWYQPAVHIAVKLLLQDRELACDISVLELLEPESHKAYGQTLLNFAQKHAASGLHLSMGGPAKQLRRRILNITAYSPFTHVPFYKRAPVFLLISALIFVCAPYMGVTSSTIASEYSEPPELSQIHLDLDGYFQDFTGTFVLFDTNKGQYKVYNPKESLKRYSPDSTYKIYSALRALEDGAITPDQNTMAWDGTEYPIHSWNKDQNLNTAMSESVNWYFQNLDSFASGGKVQEFIQTLGYGNQDLSGGLSSFWLESSLKISAMEQVELLQKVFRNELGCADKNIQAVKDAMFISSENGNLLYGKTGTGMVNGEYISGWFVGCLKTLDNEFYFALHIKDGSHPDGSAAAAIAMNILDEILHDYKKLSSIVLTLFTT